MCGIVGYIGDKKSIDVLTRGLEKLEYRGYDSAGIAVVNKDEMKIVKCKGRLKNLEENLEEISIDSHVGIGHTRWATHGEPSDVNSHPHVNHKGNIAVVHNGIIENYLEIKEELKKSGYSFVSETDTEVIPYLIDMYYDGDLKKAVMKAIKKLKGAFALGVLSLDEKDKLIAVRKDSPLIIGLGEGENFIASDIPAVIDWTKDIYILENGEMAEITKDHVSIMDFEGNPIQKKVYKVTWDIDEAKKGGYDHFMIKEIFEQPKAIKDTLMSRIDDSGKINLDNIDIKSEDIKNIEKIYIVACGTAYHAGLVGKALIEKYARIPVLTDIASEFRYNNPFIDEKTLMIVVSQSGETADTLAALRLAKEKKAKVLAVCNVVGSSISREADYVFYTWAGPEIAVASTKAYTTQVVSLALIALYMADMKGTIDEFEYKKVLEEVKVLPEKIEKILESQSNIKSAASYISKSSDIFYIGRGFDYYLAMEGSLKLKEVSYIHSEAMAAGELKHGTLALIEENTPVLALATQDFLYDKMISNIKEVKARGAYTIALAKEGNTEIKGVADFIIYIPSAIDELTAPLAVIPLQLLAYYVATERGCDVDKPRNLAKSVTVE
ncbi:glutamine--fructose-6-phosphate transaminase (isomerizing) [Sporanaerobacter acetigenes]|uniref:Glutamine--fructose-6-phosphate aminotransferase [isomerizing] n=1 Tax=Sporanaerobacter acetigenes DSM 13106 TaxID=1123281 RepID=A0A1M5XBB0_9FIRM|nr:glutamine--fructose-6-phosphate transaminase (isomerizing) [Sporanaerobacter acetigenes]SHH96483.1 glutamine--fructose-6-phosphate transaminase [Sporanaerobacter acetigenes DSM 13106]